MPYITTKTLTAPRSTSRAVGTFQIRVPYDRDTTDRTLVRILDDIPLVDGKLTATDIPAGPYEVRRNIKGAAPATTVAWTPFVIPATTPVSGAPGTIDITVGGSTVVAWNLYYLADQSIPYAPAVVQDAQAARDAAQGFAAAAAASAARLDAVVAGAPTALDTLDELAAALGDDANFAATITTALSGKYVKPGPGIPKSDLATAIGASLDKADTAYQKPGAGVPKADLVQAVRDSLDKADASITKAAGDTAYAAMGDTVGFDSGTGTRKTAAALQRAFASTGAADIGIVGDSVTAAYTGAAFDFPGSWYRRLKATLVADGYADGGSGWVAALQGDPAAVDPRWVISANWSLSNYGYILSTANGAIATFTSDAAGTSVEVTYGNTANPFTVSIDGGTAVTVTPNGSPAVKVYAVSGLANTTHSVTITAQSSAVIVGVQVKAANGVRFHSLGKYGMTAESFSTDVFSLKTAALAAVPTLDAVIIMVGANDLTAGKTPAAAIDRLREIRQLWPNADAILAIEPQTTAEVTTTVWNDFQARVRALGVELGAPIIDFHRRWGGATTSAALGFIGADNKHPNAAGQRDIASTYLNRIRQVYLPPTTFAPQTTAVAKRSVPYCFEMCQQAVGQAANTAIQLKRPFRLPIKPTRFRIHFANRVQLGGAFVTGAAGDLVGLRVALGKPTVNATTGEPTGAWASPIEVMSATNVANGSIQSTPWIDPATHGMTAGDMMFLGYSFTTSASSPQIAYNGGLSWQSNTLADLMSTTAVGTRANNSSFLQVIIEIEHTDAAASHLLIVGNSLSGPSAGGVYDNYGELGTYHQQWAMRTRNFASSIAVAGSYASAFNSVNSKWTIFDNFAIPYLPDVVLYYASASSDVADSTSDSTTNDIKTNVINMIKAGKTKFPTARQWLTDIPPRVAFTGDRASATTNEGQRMKLNQWLHMLPVQTEQCLNLDALFTDWANPARLRDVFTTDGTHGTRIFHDLAAGGIHLGRKVSV